MKWSEYKTKYQVSPMFIDLNILLIDGHVSSDGTIILDLVRDRTFTQVLISDFKSNKREIMTYLGMFSVYYKGYKDGVKFSKKRVKRT